MPSTRPGTQDVILLSALTFPAYPAQDTSGQSFQVLGIPGQHRNPGFKAVPAPFHREVVSETPGRQAGKGQQGPAEAKGSGRGFLFTSLVSFKGGGTTYS